MGDNGVILFVSKHLDTEYCFYEDYMTVNGTPLRYSEMVDIDEVEGDSPAFVFNYGGKRFDLPYDPRYKEQIRPFFVKAALMEPTIKMEPEPAESYEEPVDEPEETVDEPAEIIEEPEETVDELAETPEESVAEEVAPAAAKLPLSEKVAGVSGKLKGISKKTLLIIAAVIVALVVCIILIATTGGKSVEGLDEKVKVEKATTEAGEEYKMTVIDEDADVEDYALNYYKECFKEGDKYHWIVNKGKGETVLLMDQDGQVLVCTFDYVEGEEEDPSILGSGSMRNTWIIYPENDQMIEV